MLPFVKWAGGKRQIVPLLIKSAPGRYGTYYEPFLGGGALALALQPKTAVLNDVNAELMHAYKAIKNNFQQFSEYLKLMELAHSQSFFKKLSTIDRNDKGGNALSLAASSALRAARLIYLNKTSFNGLYRVNAAGHYNVPWNQALDVKIADFDNLKAISQWLKNNQITLKNGDYKSAVKTAVANDFVYFDPPYDYDVSNGFKAFAAPGFGKKEQSELATTCKELAARGVFVMISNHDTPLVRALYQGFHFQAVSVRRSISSNGAKRGLAKEVIITSYAH